MTASEYKQRRFADESSAARAEKGITLSETAAQDGENNDAPTERQGGSVGPSVRRTADVWDADGRQNSGIWADPFNRY